MSRKRKKDIKQINNANIENNDAPLTQEQVYDVFEFAKSYYNSVNGINGVGRYMDGAYTPYLTNERLSEIGLTPRSASQNDLVNYMKSPINNQDALVGYSEFLQITDMTAKRAVGYLGNLPSFDYWFYCTNIQDSKEVESDEYKRDEGIVKDFLSKFDVKGQFSSICRRMSQIDAYYSVFRMDGEKYEFQELPYNYCKITGKNLSWGYQFDFDMNWFLKMGLSLEQYPPIFAKMFNRVMEEKNLGDYNPANPLNKRMGTFALWSQTSSLPNKGNFTCFKMNSDIYSTIPYLTPAFQDAVNKPLIRKLQNDQYIIASHKIMIGLIPLLKEQKSGQIKDALAVNPTTMGQFLALLKRGLSDAIKITGAPFSDVKQVDFELPTKNMYDEYSKSLAANTGVTSRIVYSSDSMTATEATLSSEVDEMLATAIYPQFAKWLSSEINFFTKKYKFNFVFEGSKFSRSREKRFDTVMRLADKGIVMPAKIASSLGMDIFQLKELMRQGKFGDFNDLLYLLPNSNTKDYGSGNIGRPKAEVPADSTERSMDYEV